MIEVLITLVPSIFWIFYRCYQILKIPVEELIENLHIEIPHTPNICIDSITENSVIFHWDIEANDEENLYYILVINNHEAATITSTSCKLNNLLENKLYQIQIIAINSITNFRSQSSPVYIQTLSEQQENLLPFIEEEKVSLIKEESQEPKTESNYELSLDITAEEIKSTESADTLNNYLVKFQNELIKINNEYRSYETNINNELATLRDQLNFYKKEFEEVTDSKVKKDHNIKDLEKQKDKLTFQKSKLSNQIKSMENSIELLNSKVTGYETKIKKLTERNQVALNNEENEKLNIKNSIKEIEKQNEKIKLDIDKIEENLKYLTTEKKELKSIISVVKPLVESFINEFTFNKDGSLNKRLFEILDDIFKILPEWKDEIMNEITTYQNFEDSWKNSFKFEIRKYLSIQHSLEIAKSNKDKSYQPVKLTEYQASIEFGGFSNALPKSKFKKLINSSNSPSPVSSAQEQNSNNDSWYNYYSQVYSNDSNDENDQMAIQQPIDQMVSQQISNADTTPVQIFSYDAQIYTNSSVLSSPIQDNSLLHLPSAPSQPQDNLQALLMNTDQLYNYQSPVLTSNTLSNPVWNQNLALNSSSDFFTNNQSVSSLNQDFNNSSSRFNHQFSNLSMSPPNINVDLNPTSNQNFLMTPSSSQLSTTTNALNFTNNLWIDNRPFQHTRSVSSNSNSQIWRNDNLSTHNFHLSAEFQPFSNISTNNNSNDNPTNAQHLQKDVASDFELSLN